MRYVVTTVIAMGLPAIAAADGLVFEVTDTVTDDGTPGKCAVNAVLTNETGAFQTFIARATPTYGDDTFSKMLAEGLGSMAQGSGVFLVGPGEAKAMPLNLVGGDCAHLKAIDLTFECQTDDPANCPETIDIVAYDAFGISQDGGELIGGAEIPRGEMHGLWIVTNTAGDEIMRLDIEQDEFGEPEVMMTQGPGLCIQAPEGCKIIPQTFVGDRGYISDDGRGDMVLFTTPGNSDGQINLDWDVASGEGRMSMRSEQLADRAVIITRQ